MDRQLIEIEQLKIEIEAIKQRIHKLEEQYIHRSGYYIETRPIEVPDSTGTPIPNPIHNISS